MSGDGDDDHTCDDGFLRDAIRDGNGFGPIAIMSQKSCLTGSNETWNAPGGVPQ